MEVKTIIEYKDLVLNKKVSRGANLINTYKKNKKELTNERIDVLLEGNQSSKNKPVVEVKIDDMDEISGGGSCEGGETSSITTDERILINAKIEPTNMDDLSYLFQNWTNLIKLDLTYCEIDPEFTPMYGMFSGCINLVALAISDSMCDRLKIMFENGEGDAITEIFEDVPVDRENIGYIYVSDEKYMELKNLRDWSDNYNLKTMSEWE